MAALEPYYSKPTMLQTPKIIAVKIVKWKMYFVDLVKDAVSNRFLRFPLNLRWMG